ncbi:head GIN domain-containing protein [Mesonia sp. HuA40]|uniref:head GIN domain-containing protein n=1 Tax=Mesonia sp. HuA40 TaxID=2602761 RepID=UPI001650AD35|nr:head GIN domain-containing protein [Mesonia sp. HuA40]
MKNVIGVFVILLLATLNPQILKAQKKFEVDEFKEIKVFSKIHVQVKIAETNRVEINAGNPDDISIFVEEGVLKIKSTLKNLWEDEDIQIDVYAKNPVILDANEGAYIYAEKINQPELHLKVQEGSEIKVVDVDVKTLRLKAVTGGILTAKGLAEDQIVKVRTGGEYDGQGLISKKTTVEINAGGLARVHATEACDAKASTGGNILIYGKPKSLNKKASFGGSISLK